MFLLTAFVALFVALVTPVVITLLQEAVIRWRYRHLPGPRQDWLTGNLREVLRRGSVLTCLGDWMARHGPLVSFRLMSRSFVLLADPDAARTVLYKVVNHAPLSNANCMLVTGKLRAFDLYGLLTAKDEYWRQVRNAWQPAFAPASLRGYQDLIDREALALTAKMEAVAVRAEGKEADGREADAGIVECLSAISRTTLAVVGTAAYGVDFNSPEFGGDGGGSTSLSGLNLSDPPTSSSSSPSTLMEAHSQQQQQRPSQPPSQRPCGPFSSSSASPEPSLVQACHDWFRTMSPTRRTRWAAATALPCLLPLVRPLACALPDAILGLHLQARRVLRKTSLRLMADWRVANATSTNSASTNSASTNTSDTPQPSGEQRQKAVDGGHTAPAVTRTAGGGVAPGSFLGLMLAARGKGSGRALTDSEIEAQVQTFLLAGFETTANALTFAMYLLAQHPDKAARMQRELDEHLPPLEEEGREGQQAPLGIEVLDKLVYTEAVLNEAMRLFTPAHGTTRLTDKPMSVLGHHIPAGTTFWIPIYHMHRSGELWPQPEAFHPERFLPDPDPALAARHPHAHLPFGSGTRMCIGYRFAIQEAKTVLARLFHRLDFQLVPGQEPLELATGLTLAPKHGVRLRVLRRLLPRSS